MSTIRWNVTHKLLTFKLIIVDYPILSQKSIESSTTIDWFFSKHSLKFNSLNVDTKKNLIRYKFVEIKLKIDRFS